MARYPLPETISPLAVDLFHAGLRLLGTTEPVQEPSEMPRAPSYMRVGRPARTGEWTRPRCIIAMRTFLDSRGRVPTREEWRFGKQHGLFSLSTLYRFWPTVAACLFDARQQGDAHVD